MWLLLVFQLLTRSIAWQGDIEFASQLPVEDSCDFARVRVSNGLLPNFIDTADYPLLLDNLMNDWPAMHKWSKQYMIDTYGNDIIRTGSESSIVFSGGVAEKLLPLRDIINGLSSNSTHLSDRLFVFDTTVTRSNPQWMSDVRVPWPLTSWDNEANEASGQMWHMLSLGASRSGLPRHYHGQTWLGLVHGVKKWFVYPPGFNPPTSIEASFNPLLPVSVWVDEVYPKLISLPKPPLYRHLNRATADNETSDDSAEGYRPLECVQRHGEVLYLPRGWSHITVNVGETLAFGGQEKSRDNVRETELVLRKNPSSYDAMRDLGLARTNAATSLKRRLQDLYGTNLIHLHSSHELIALLTETRDTWLVVSCNADSGVRESVMQVLQTRLNGMVNVAVIEECTCAADTNGTSECNQRLQVKLHRGLKTSQVTSKSISDNLPGIDADGVRLVSDGFYITEIEQFVVDVVNSQDLNYGSISTVPTSAQLLYNEGIHYLRMSLAVKYHPENYNLLCEILAETDDQAAMSECISRAMSACDSMIEDTRASRLALSSIYHRLSRIYMMKNLFHAVIPLLQRSLRMNPFNTAALRDQVIAYLNIGDKPMASQSLHILESNVEDYAVAIDDYAQLKAAVHKM